jgi:hypothetical protein
MFQTASEGACDECHDLPQPLSGAAWAGLIHGMQARRGLALQATKSARRSGSYAAWVQDSSLLLLRPSDIKPKQHDIPVFDDIILAFRAPFARFARPGFAAMVDIVLIAHGFGADEALFKIRMDRARCLRSLGPANDGPGPCFLWANFDADENATRFFGGPKGRAAAWELFATAAGIWALRGCGLFSVFTKQSETWVGRVGPWKPEGATNEIGYAILSTYWG